MTTLRHNRWHTSVVLIRCWKPRSFPGATGPQSTMEAGKNLLSSQWRHQQPLARREESQREDWQWEGAKGGRTFFCTPLSFEVLPGGASHNQGRPFHSNQRRWGRSSGETPCTTDSSLWRGGTQTNYTEKMKAQPNSQIHRFKTRVFSSGPALKKCWQDPFRLEWKVTRQESRTI